MERHLTFAQSTVHHTFGSDVGDEVGREFLLREVGLIDCDLNDLMSCEQTAPFSSFFMEQFSAYPVLNKKLGTPVHNPRRRLDLLSVAAELDRPFS